MDIKFMERCLELAKAAYDKEEVPVGCVIVKNGEIIAESINTKYGKKNVTGHAEMNAINIASKRIGDWRLEDCDIYVNLEPCIMCGGAIYQSRIKNVYYGARDEKGGCFHSNLKLLSVKGLNHYPNVIGGIMEEESKELIKSFFREKRNLKKKTGGNNGV